MKIIIIGAVAVGTSAAAKARRNSESAEIVIYEKDGYISYSGCGMPYYIGGSVEQADALTPRDALFFKRKYNVDIKTLHEVIAVSSATKKITVKNLNTQEVFVDDYDKLVIATGAVAVKPSILGIDMAHVFTLRNIKDMKRIKKYLDLNNPQTALIIGTGFIGLEMCENLSNLRMKVTMLERQPYIAPGLDEDMSVYIQDYLSRKNISVLTGVSASKIKKNHVILSSGKEIQADFILVAIGARPNTELAVATGIELGSTGAIKVNEKMETNLLDIYACGDCIEQFDLVTGSPMYRPLGSTANKTGRIAGDNVTGGELTFRGILGTSIFKILIW